MSAAASSHAPADAIVFFGATGDLAHKQIFPALQSMERHGRLDVPIICVARQGWTLDRLRARMRQSIADHGGADDGVVDRVAARLQYVAGEYHEAATFDRLRAVLGRAERPVFYLAIEGVKKRLKRKRPPHLRDVDESHKAAS